LSCSFQNAQGEDFSTEPNSGRPYVVMGRPLYSAAVVSSFHCPFSAVTDWMFTTLPQMTRP